jgi:hypothetical protein
LELNRFLDLDQVGIDFRSKSWFMASTWIIAGQKICLVLIGCISRIGLGLVFFYGPARNGQIWWHMFRSNSLCISLCSSSVFYYISLKETLPTTHLTLLSIFGILKTYNIYNTIIYIIIGWSLNGINIIKTT